MKAILYMPDEFMRQEVDRVISWEEGKEILGSFDLSPFKVFDVGDYDVIYFSHRMEADTISDRDVLKREVADICSVLGKYFPENRIVRKHHPDHPDDVLTKVGDTLDAFIPAELLYSEKVKLYLSYWSVSIAHIEEGTVVSLMDLISCKSDEIRAQLKEILMQESCSEILFPRSLDEFEKIVASVAGVKRQDDRQ